MKYGRKIAVYIFAMFLIAGTLALSASAQTRGRVIRGTPVLRPVIVQRYVVRDPFWRYNRWGWGNAGWYDPYWNNPYLRYQETNYYREKAVRDARRELAIHREKYRADGFISAKEQKELNEDQRDLQKAIQKLNKFLRES